MSKLDVVRKIASKNELTNSIVVKTEKTFRKPYRKLKRFGAKLITYKNYRTVLAGSSEDMKAVYRIEYRKYKNMIKANPLGDDLKIQQAEIFKDQLILCSNNFKKNLAPESPIVICVVKNDLERMKLFFSYYRKLGIEQFVIIDNGSDDGTFEFLTSQNDARVYQVREKFETHKKEAWIEKVLSITGWNRWYIVVDSDELLDFVGSEEHQIKDLIKFAEANNYKRLWGFMLDMYSDGPLFSVECPWEEIVDNFCYFDTDSYIFDTEDRASCAAKVDYIHGGPRYRLFNSDMVQSKQAVFYYEKNCLYRNCHFMQPILRWGMIPCCFVLRHYKYLKQDEKAYRERVKSQNFAGGSKDYKLQMEAISKNVNISFMYEKTVKYDNSASLKSLPMLKTVEME